MFLINSKSSMTESYGGGYSSGVSYSSNPFSGINGGAIAVAAIVAFILTIILFVLIVEKKKAPRGKFTRWLREYLNFRSILISGIIKFIYLFSAIFLTIYSVVVMCQGRDEMVLPMIGIGFAILVFGNIFLRITMEMTMAIIMLWENSSDIRAVLVKEEEKPEEEKPEEKKAPKEVPVAPKEIAEQPEVKQPEQQ